MTVSIYTTTLVSSVTTSTAVANTVTETILVPDFAFPANYFLQSTRLRATMIGQVSNVVTAAPTMTIRVRIGPLTLSTVAVFATGALAANTTANTNLTWRANLMVSCRSVGTTGTVTAGGEFWFPNLTGATITNLAAFMMPSSAPTTATLDTTVVNIMSISGQWGTANAANSIQVTDYTLESLV